MLLALALTAARIAVIQGKEARIQGREAREQQRLATARQLIAQAEAARDRDPRAALRLGLAAQHLHSDSETRASLINTLISTRAASTLTGHTDPVNAVAFAPDGGTLATGSADGTVILWDLTDPARPRRLGVPLAGHTGGVTSVAFAPDGRTLAIAGANGRTILWDVSSLGYVRENAVALACDIVGGGLEPSDWARYVQGLPYKDTCPGT